METPQSKRIRLRKVEKLGKGAVAVQKPSSIQTDIRYMMKKIGVKGNIKMENKENMDRKGLQGVT